MLHSQGRSPMTGTSNLQCLVRELKSSLSLNGVPIIKWLAGGGQDIHPTVFALLYHGCHAYSYKYLSRYRISTIHYLHFQVTAHIVEFLVVKEEVHFFTCPISLEHKYWYFNWQSWGHTNYLLQSCKAPYICTLKELEVMAVGFLSLLQDI